MPYLLFLKKRQNLQLSSAANYRWRFKGYISLVLLIQSTICMLGNIASLLCHLIFFAKLTFYENSFRNTVGVSNRLEPVQARPLVGPDLAPNCLQRFSADDFRLHWQGSVNITTLYTNQKIKYMV